MGDLLNCRPDEFRHGPLASMSMMRSAKGAPITIIKEGKINIINGTVIRTGRRAARCSKRTRRSVRISAATARSDPASGVPNLIDWLSATTMPRRLAMPALCARLSNA